MGHGFPSLLMRSESKRHWRLQGSRISNSSHPRRRALGDREISNDPGRQPIRRGIESRHVTHASPVREVARGPQGSAYPRVAEAVRRAESSASSVPGCSCVAAVVPEHLGGLHTQVSLRPDRSLADRWDWNGAALRVACAYPAIRVRRLGPLPPSPAWARTRMSERAPTTTSAS